MNEFSEAPPELPRADPIAGEFVTETFAYDGGRQVTVYVPPDPPEAIVFAGDGQLVVVHCYRAAPEVIRLISAQPATPSERAQYAAQRLP